VEDPEYAVSQLAQTTMRSELGQLALDEVFKERATSVVLYLLVQTCALQSRAWPTLMALDVSSFASACGGSVLGPGHLCFVWL
jgi:regulator of protease activity HflC (stomatin/prohibitin superfamily)